MFPFLAMLALKEFLQGKVSKVDFNKALKYSLGIVGGLCLFFVLLPGALFDFSSEADARMGFPDWLKDALIADRENLMRMDALRSLAFVLAAAALLWFSFKGKVKQQVFILVMGALILVDLWGVDKRYLNDKDFERKKSEAAIDKTMLDEQILADPDPHYRVYNNTTDFDKDALTAYYHKTLGGYHGAKMRRYQELIEWHLARNNMECFNMLNAKYFIVGDSTGNKFAQRNPFSNGNAWFVKELKWVASADEEITSLTGFKSRETAIINKKFETDLKGFAPAVDSNASIVLTKYQPNKLNYEYNSASEQYVVFSEIYYDKGWNAYLDGNLVPYQQVDYVLRGMKVPAGKHQIEFRFEPTVISKGESIAYASSITLYGLLIAVLAMGFIRKKKEA
jgi:hypothetical protein